PSSRSKTLMRRRRGGWRASSVSPAPVRSLRSTSTSPHGNRFVAHAPSGAPESHYQTPAIAASEYSSQSGSLTKMKADGDHELELASAESGRRCRQRLGASDHLLNFTVEDRIAGAALQAVVQHAALTVHGEVE